MDSEPKAVNRGWFFPIAIVNLLKKGTISAPEFILLGIINELCNPRCFASNHYLAEKWGKSPQWVVETLAKFRDLGLIRSNVKYHPDGSKRRYMQVTFAGDEMIEDGRQLGLPTQASRAASGRQLGLPISSNKEVTNSRDSLRDPGAHDSSDSFGLAEKAFTVADDLAQIFSDWTVKNGLHKGRAGSYMNGWTKRTMGNWSRSCRQLLTQEESKEVRRVLVWYTKHWKDEYVPQCYSMRKFCERFVDIQRRMHKSDGEDVPRKKTLAAVAIVNGKRIEYFDQEEA